MEQLGFFGVVYIALALVAGIMSIAAGVIVKEHEIISHKHAEENKHIEFSDAKTHR